MALAASEQVSNPRARAGAVFWSAVPAHTLAEQAGGRGRRGSLAADTSMWRDADWLHRAVMGMFGWLPGDTNTKRAGAGVLFRVEPSVGTPVILVQSSAAPVHAPRGTRTRTVVPGGGLRTGDNVRFRVAVNAVRRGHRTNEQGRQRGIETPVAAEDLDGWLVERVAGALTDVLVWNSARTLYRSARSPESRAAEHGDRVLQVDLLDGLAIVADPTKLTALLLRGVGRSRSYGCGLLTVARG